MSTTSRRPAPPGSASENQSSGQVTGTFPEVLSNEVPVSHRSGVVAGPGIPLTGHSESESLSHGTRLRAARASARYQPGPPGRRRRVGGLGRRHFLPGAGVTRTRRPAPVRPGPGGITVTRDRRASGRSQPRRLSCPSLASQLDLKVTVKLQWLQVKLASSIEWQHCHRCCHSRLPA